VEHGFIRFHFEAFEMHTAQMKPRHCIKKKNKKKLLGFWIVAKKCIDLKKNKSKNKKKKELQMATKKNTTKNVSATDNDDTVPDPDADEISMENADPEGWDLLVSELNEYCIDHAVDFDGMNCDDGELVIKMFEEHVRTKCSELWERIQASGDEMACEAVVLERANL
jgi:hypothetical protein